MNINKIFTHLTIRTKLIVAFLAIGLIPILLLGSFSMISSSKTLQNSAVTQIEASLSAKVGRVRDSLLHAEKDLRLLSQSPSLTTFAEFYPNRVMGSNNLNRMLISTLEDFAEKNLLYDEILLLNQQGEQILWLFRQNGDLYIEGSTGSLQLDKEDFFWKALDTRRGEAVVTTRADTGKNDATLIYSTAIHDRGQRRKGVLALKILIKDLAKIAQSVESLSGNSYLLDHGGAFLYSIDSDQRSPVQGGFPGTLEERSIQKILSGDSGLITNEEDRILTYAPIHFGAGGPDDFWVVVTDLSRSTVLAPVRRFLLFFGTMTISLIIIGTLLGIKASHHFTRPILKLHKGAQIIATGNFDHRIRVNTNDEIEDLAVQFNRMADRLYESRLRLTQSNEELQKEVEERTQQLLHAEKMAALGGLSAGIAHEIGNPLASMKTNLQLLEERLDNESSHRHAMKRILKEIDRLNSFLKTFASFARPAKPKIVSHDIRKVIREVILFVKPEAEIKGVRFHERFDENVPLVLADSQKMQQIFLNLILNATQAMPKGGEINIDISLIQGNRNDSAETEQVAVTISDTGPGIPEALLSKIFEPFFTTKPKGIGLGLSIVHQLTIENHGSISVKSTSGKGTSFTVLLQTTAAPVMGGDVPPAVRI